MLMSSHAGDGATGATWPWRAANILQSPLMTPSTKVLLRRRYRDRGEDPARQDTMCDVPALKKDG
jgi:hypothetical protein